ncbi:N-6 DNA methylase [Rubrivirga sp.]|uniref:N-6 DNA methylase n=1 Tax=Rubrivirga sp. TaxID=1885344 RepID=UPI003B51E9BA
MQHSIAGILRTSNYGLDLFTADEIAALDLIDKKGKPYLHDPIRSKDVRAKPEEIVRQLFLRQLTGRYGYPADRIGVEKAVRMGRDTSKSADVIITDADDPQAAYVIVEVKRPTEKKGIEQLKTYANAQGAPLAVWTNGATIRILHREQASGKAAGYVGLDRLPLATETIDDVLDRTLTIDQLAQENRLVTERLTLKSIILDLENLVLANSGVDAFEEVFKLVYAKLYDEWAATNERRDRLVHFRVAGTDSKTAERIRGLFEAAKDKWPGIFLDGETINLTPGQLKTAVSFLQGIKLFNSNLQVIDEAFEYLTVAVAKGSKGQYFTPRHVIDMAVMMTDPQRNETVIDTAAGSCGFTVHALFHVWGDEFTAEGPKPWQVEYAREKVYALDFDARSVKVARALNLIAGDGKTNVYRANTLDPREWDEDTRVGMKRRLRKMGSAGETRENAEAMRFFDFDVLLANPPFAGDLTDARILRQYDLARKVEAVDPETLADDPDAFEEYQRSPFARYRDKPGKWDSKQPRDVLFIERNLDFLAPGGRMAVVLPQGRFNNVTDGYLRAWIGAHARIVAVVGLDVDTFKPHTGTKTSVLVLQKWNEDPESDTYNPRRDDYPIFFATSEVSGKNSRGDYVHLIDPEDGGLLLDLEGHPIVDHDLFDVRGVLRGQMARQRVQLADNPAALAAAEARYKRLVTILPNRETIAEAFADFARQQGLSFAPEAD